MIAYGTYKTSAAWKLYAKAQGLPFEVANEVSQQIKKYENAYKHADEEEKENIKVYDYIKKEYREIFDGSSNYLNLITSWSIAPCSYLLYQGNIREEIGLVRAKDNICCVMDGHWAEEGHFLKNDLLTVKVVDLISKVFERIKVKPFDVNELLEKIKDDKATWEIYKKGCTIGVNQVEQVGTAARCRTYAPQNISELCAFIAAIRPGFASMYKTFESRKPFKYGVDSFDKLIQTDEMPNSFVLYQEQEMAALNFAGISMGDSYTAVKNIAKKRTEKVLAYKDMFLDGFSKSILEQGKSQEEAEKLSLKLWQIIEDSANYSFNASHSYCMAIDSLYCAYLKAHYPLEFYETILKQMADKGNKDKMLLLKNEAEDYFGISFPPFRFGQDNREIRADKETNQIVNSLVSIKGFSKSFCSLLYQCYQFLHSKYGDDMLKNQYHNGNVVLKKQYLFLDILKWLDEHSCKSSKVTPLIKIGYFAEFGNERELTELVETWDYLKQGTAKELNKEKIPEEYLEVIKKNCTDEGVNGNILKSYQVKNCEKLLRELADDIYAQNMPDFSFQEIAMMQTEVMGYFDLTTGKEEDRKKLFILEVFPLENKFSGGVWKYRVNCKSIGSGKNASLSINSDLYNKNKFEKGDIIYVEIAKDKKGYWNIYEVKKIQEAHISN